MPLHALARPSTVPSKALLAVGAGGTAQFPGLFLLLGQMLPSVAQSHLDRGSRVDGMKLSWLPSRPEGLAAPPPPRWYDTTQGWPAAVASDVCAGWGTMLVVTDVTLSVLSVLLYIVGTYLPLNSVSNCGWLIWVDDLQTAAVC